MARMGEGHILHTFGLNWERKNIEKLVKISPNQTDDTVPTRPNVTESRPQLNPRSAFGVYSWFAPGLLGETQR